LLFDVIIEQLLSRIQAVYLNDRPSVFVFLICEKSVFKLLTSRYRVGKNADKPYIIVIARKTFNQVVGSSSLLSLSKEKQRFSLVFKDFRCFCF